jgi:hypothetical protein
MPQGLPKKIEVGLLLPDLAFQLGYASARRLALRLHSTAQRRTIEPARSRSARTAQPLQPTTPRQFTPIVQPTSVDP